LKGKIDLKVLVGSRGSKLALTQTNWIIDKLKSFHPEVEFEVKVIKTKGDKIVDIALDKIGDKGLFVKEIEEELLRGGIDLAVHSMKDIPSELPQGLAFAGIPEREDCRDALILKEGLHGLRDIPIGGRIGTGSKRRKYQLLMLRPDLDIIPIRGNVDTRLRKMEEMGLHGIVLAAAGLKRLGLEQRISCYLSIEEMLPAPAQGALAIEIRKDDKVIKDIVEKIRDEKAEIQVRAERFFLNNLNGSCQIPVGAVCIIDGRTLILHGLFGTEDGEILIRKSIQGKLGEERELGRSLAQEVLKELRSYEG
jgi:hydroxymethylbilane synthase